MPINTDADTCQWENARDSTLGRVDRKKRAELNKLFRQLPHKSLIDGRKNQPMNKELQVININKKIHSMGYQPDSYDITQIAEGKLRYEENIKNVLGTFQFRKPDEDLTKEELEDAERKNADLYIEYICETTGRSREEVETEMLLAKQAEEENQKRASEAEEEEKLALLNSDIYNYNCQEQFAIYKKIESNSAIRVSHVFKVPIVEKLVKLIPIKTLEKVKLDQIKNIDSREDNPFVESGYLHDSIIKYGLYNLIIALAPVQEAKILYEEIINCFTDPRIIFKIPFTIVRQNILNGAADDVFWLQSNPEQKIKIQKVQREFGIKNKTDVPYFILIFALDSLYKNQTIADGYEHAHYYTKGELLYDLLQQIEKYAKSMNEHFVNILPILEEELAIKKLLLEHGYNIEPQNIVLKENVISRIKEIARNNLQSPNLTF